MESPVTVPLNLIFCVVVSVTVRAGPPTAAMQCPTTPVRSTAATTPPTPSIARLATGTSTMIPGHFLEVKI